SSSSRASQLCPAQSGNANPLARPSSSSALVAGPSRCAKRAPVSFARPSRAARSSAPPASTGPPRQSAGDPCERIVVVGGPVHLAIVACDDPAGAPIRRARRRHGVLVVVAAGAIGQEALPVLEGHAVLAVR